MNRSQALVATFLVCSACGPSTLHAQSYPTANAEPGASGAAETTAAPEIPHTSSEPSAAAALNAGSTNNSIGPASGSAPSGSKGAKALTGSAGGSGLGEDPSTPSSGAGGKSSGLDDPGKVKPVHVRVQEAQVLVEVDKKVVGAGLLLRGDGRVLVALRTEGRESVKARDVTLRFFDGARVPGKVMHADAEAGLALVVPQEGRRTMFGLFASDLDPQTNIVARLEGKELKATALATPALPTSSFAPAGMLVVRDARDEPKPGAPLLDSNGNVSALATRVCPAPAKLGEPESIQVVCANALAPVAILRRFLVSTPTTAALPAAWLGIGGEVADGTVRGVRVTAVAPAGPAAAAGIHADPDPSKSDVIVSVDDQAVQNPEDLSKRIAAKAAGDKIKLSVFRAKQLKDITVVLKAAPPTLK
jgi:PDZ domain